MSLNRLAFMETINGATLTRAQYDDLLVLAKTILNSRTGKSVSTGPISRAVRQLNNEFDSFTTPTFLIKRYMASNLSQAEFVRKNTPQLLTPSDKLGYLIGNSAYNVCSSGTPRDLLRVFDLFMTPAKGEIFFVFNLGQQPGFEFAQLRDLLISSSDQLKLAADRFGDTSLLQTIASLKRARIAVPRHALMFVTQQQINLNYRMVYGAIDSNLSSTPTFYPKQRMSILNRDLSKLWQSQTRDLPVKPKDKYVDSLLRGKTIQVIGRPPSGWSLDRINTLLRPLKSSASTDAGMNADLVIYNPDERALMEERLKYHSDGLPRITYDQAISILMLGNPAELASQ